MSMKSSHNWEEYRVTSDMREIIFENARLKAINAQQVCGKAVRVLKNGRVGFLSERAADSSRSDLIEQAAELAEQGSKFYGTFYNSASSYPTCASHDQTVASVSTDELLGLVNTEIERVKQVVHDAVIDAYIGTSIGEVGIRNSNGIDKSYPKSSFSFAVGTNIIEETSFFYAYTVLNRTRFTAALSEWTDRLITQLSFNRTPKQLDTGAYPVLFTPHAVMSLVGILQYGLNAHTVHRKISPLADKRGQSIFDERFSLLEDSLAENSPFIGVCDDEGVPLQRKYIVENGVLNHFLTDLDSAAKLDIEPTGNGWRCNPFTRSLQDVTSKPSPTPTNWCISPGNIVHDDQLKSIKRGVLIDQLLGLHTGNLLNGDFSCTISTGFVVEDGTITGRIKDCVVSGNIYKILAGQLIGFSSDTEEVDATGVHTVPYMFCKDISIAAQ